MEKNKSVYLFYALILLYFFYMPSVYSTESTEPYAIFSMHDAYDTFSKSKARMIYRGKIKSIGKNKIQLSDWPDNAIEKKEFYDALLGQTLSQVNGYWASLAFSGKAKQPNTIDTSDISALVDWLQQHPNGIGYAPLSQLPKGAYVHVIISKEY
ncbi:hypothetical protein PVK62_01125 [Aliivibrio sp. S3MY1]|uniref:hypothetical protein n=1 Tax=unclassified Aliivibrio TaxID=2645654 RepID=UPI0023792F99|nr:MULTISPECIES: hypothetical protein [unclassified Aliivibrio]MDD9194433.1 hypothetical protein [Aliivibrio sp. S3MY1]MDD9198228.1 hypothetical protein [Aliivibrio sp. S2MY1]